jgi:hypothetical protein
MDYKIDADVTVCFFFLIWLVNKGCFITFWLVYRFVWTLNSNTFFFFLTLTYICNILYTKWIIYYYHSLRDYSHFHQRDFSLFLSVAWKVHLLSKLKWKRCSTESYENLFARIISQFIIGYLRTNVDYESYHYHYDYHCCIALIRLRMITSSRI